MAQLLGRYSVVERVAAAVDRTRVAGGGTSWYAARAVWARALWVEEALRPFGTKVSRGRGAVPPDADAAVWWIDAQRMQPSDAERLGSATVAISRVVLLSGRAPLGTSLAAVVRNAVRADPSRVVDVAPLDPQDALALSLACRATGGATVKRRRGYWSSRPRRAAGCAFPRRCSRPAMAWAGRRCASPSTIC